MVKSKINVYTIALYSGSSEDNDIALIKLPKAVTFNDYVKPICIPDSPVPAGIECFAAGWGKNSKGSKCTCR